MTQPRRRWSARQRSSKFAGGIFRHEKYWSVGNIGANVAELEERACLVVGKVEAVMSNYNGNGYPFDREQQEIDVIQMNAGIWSNLLRSGDYCVTAWSMELLQRLHSAYPGKKLLTREDVWELPLWLEGRTKPTKEEFENSTRRNWIYYSQFCRDEDEEGGSGTQEIAEEPLEIFEAPEPTGTWRLLTRRQKMAVRQLQCVMKAREQRNTLGFVGSAWHGLVCGPSGAGKSLVIQAAAEVGGLRYIGLNASTWIPQGSANERKTLRCIANSLHEAGECVIHIDEIDKLRMDVRGQSEWTNTLTTELMALIDGRLGLSSGWGGELVEKLNRTFIVASGAFEEILGCDLSAFEMREGVGRIDQLDCHHGILPELYGRLSVSPIFLPSPSRDELYPIAEQALIRLYGRRPDRDEVEECLDETLLTRGGMRALERAIFRRYAALETREQNPGGRLRKR